MLLHALNDQKKINFTKLRRKKEFQVKTISSHRFSSIYYTKTVQLRKLLPEKMRNLQIT